MAQTFIWIQHKGIQSLNIFGFKAKHPNVYCEPDIWSKAVIARCWAVHCPHTVWEWSTALNAWPQPGAFDCESESVIFKLYGRFHYLCPLNLKFALIVSQVTARFSRLWLENYLRQISCCCTQSAPPNFWKGHLHVVLIDEAERELGILQVWCTVL